MWRTRRWKGVRIPVSSSWVHGNCFVGAPLVAPGADPAATWGRLIDASAAAIGTGAFVGFDLIPADGPFGEVLASGELGGGWQIETLAERSRAVLTRDGTGEEPLALSGRKRRELRRHGRRLAEELGGELVTVERSAEPSAVEAFLALESAGWKGAAGTAFSSSAVDQAFFRGLCASLADQGRLELLSLECAGRVVAMKCNIRTGDTVHCFKICHDPEVGRHSPGVLLELVNLERYVADTAVRRMDSCADPENAMINRLWTGRRSFAIAAAARGARARLLLPALRLAARTRTTGGHL